MTWDTIQDEVSASKSARAANSAKRKTKKNAPKPAASPSSSSSDNEAQQQESSDLSSGLSSSSSASSGDESSKPRSMRNKVFGRLGQRIVSCAECSKPLLEGALLEHMARMHSADDTHTNKRARLDNSLDGDDDDDDSDLDVKPTIINGKNTTPTTAAAHAMSKSQQQTPKYTPEPLIIDGDGEETNMAAALKRKEKLLKANKAAAGSRKGRGPVDVDVQCGVITDKGVPCQRSLTCKTHSMGAKRAVAGRSGLYDVLLSEWQKRNQVGTGSAGTPASATKIRQQNSVAATPTLSSSVNNTPVTGASATAKAAGLGANGGNSSTTTTPTTSQNQDSSSSVVAAIASATQAAPNPASSLTKLKKSSSTPGTNLSTSVNDSATATSKLAGTPSTTGSTLINSKKVKRKKVAGGAGATGDGTGLGGASGSAGAGGDDRRWYGEAPGDDEDAADEEDSEMDVEAEMVLLSVAGAGMRRSGQVKTWLCPPETARQSISPLTSALAVRNSGMGRFRSALAQALAPSGIM